MPSIDLRLGSVLAAALIGAVFAAGGVLVGRGVTDASYTDTAVSGVISVSVTTGQPQIQIVSGNLPAQLVAVPAASPVPVASTAPQQNPTVTRRAMVKLKPRRKVEPDPPAASPTPSSAPAPTSPTSTPLASTPPAPAPPLAQ